MRRSVIASLAMMLLAAGLSGCGSRPAVAPPPPACSPPAGGRCPHDVAWPGHMFVSPGGRLLHGVILCGGTLVVTEQTSSRVTVRLHLSAMGPGTMSCARVDVHARLANPLDHRPVYDAVSGRLLKIDVAAGCRRVLRCP